MHKIPIPELKAKLISSGKIDLVQLEEMITNKINELSGLISAEGAVHIIANDLGVELYSNSIEIMKIKNLSPGMRMISVAGKVIRKFSPRAFNSNGRQGQVCSLVLADETDTIRMVFWNDQIESMASLKEQDMVVFKEVYVKENNGSKELHFGDRGSMEVNPPGLSMESVKEELALENKFTRKEIGKLQDDELNVELLGTVVQVFDPHFFLVHPETGRKMREYEDQQVVPALSYVLNLMLDDGTGIIRCTFWKNQTKGLLEKTDQQIAQYKDNLTSFEDIKTELLGEQLKLCGKVKKNDLFGRLEFNVQLVEKANPEEELARLKNE